MPVACFVMITHRQTFRLRWTCRWMRQPPRPQPISGSVIWSTT